ncbi:MAG: ABC transporter permease [Bacteroidota bacterium]
MFRLLVEKELRDLLGTPRFVLTFAISALLIILAFFMGAKNYQLMEQRYISAQQENNRQIESLTTEQWMMVSPTIFVPPSALAALVSGVSNDIGRSVPIQGRGELNLENSYFSDNTSAAVFRLLDLEFVFTIVFSLFAILFCYNAVNGEKEQGTLRLLFSNSLARDQYILGKIAGSFLALGLPLLVPILIGCLLFMLMGIPMTGDDWIRLAGIIACGFLFFGVFVMISIFVSALTVRSSSSFILLLVIWILTILIIPRTAVLFAGRAVEVPSVDEISYQKRQLQSQLVQEDMKALAKALGGESDGGSISFEFREESTSQEEAQERMEERMNKFRETQEELADAREEKMANLSERLNTERYNRQRIQQKWAFGLSRISPASAFTLAITNLAGTSLDAEDQFMQAANDYQQVFRTFQEEKAGMSGGGGFMIVMRTNNENEPPPEAIKISEVPVFEYASPRLASIAPSLSLDIGLLVFFNLFFFAAAFVAFLKYDVR